MSWMSGGIIAREGEYLEDELFDCSQLGVLITRGGCCILIL